ncbi:Reticulocyte-binding protein 2 homolog a [Durusdinium trenchii]|uniref:Reticulocyte-binding protein 2 homolog a n=1 Tax=Durusdinium trenchii TaxID=1381693 RepID=A0ABP0RQ98_9DINO
MSSAAAQPSVELPHRACGNMRRIQSNELTNSAIISACEKGDVITFSTTLSALKTEAQHWSLALDLLGSMMQRFLQPDEVTYSSMVSGYERSQCWREALHALRLPRDRMGITWTSAVTACEASSHWQAVLQLLSHVLSDRLRLDTLLVAAALRCFARARQWQKAQHFAELWQKAGGEEDVVCSPAEIRPDRTTRLQRGTKVGLVYGSNTCCVSWSGAIHRIFGADGEDQPSCSSELLLFAGQKGCGGVAQQALQDRDVELRQLQEQQARSEEQWKAQIVKLVEEMRRAEQKSSTLAKELAASKGELQRLKAGGQDVVRRYEEESGRRLELEERCLQLEEKLKTREQRTRNDADCAHKLKQCQQAKEVAEQQAKENEERSQKAAERLEEVESRQKDLEAEVQRLKLQCSEKSRRIEELEAASVQEMEPLGPSGPPRPPIPRSRPGTASSAGSASVGTSRVGAGDSRKLRTQPPAFQSHGERLPPGAIRRGGSVPVRRSQGPPPRANLQSRSISPNASASQRTPPSARTKSPQTERPVSQSSYGSCGEDGFDGIPTDSEDSSEEEVLTGVNTAA